MNLQGFSLPQYPYYGEYYPYYYQTPSQLSYTLEYGQIYTQQMQHAPSQLYAQKSNYHNSTSNWMPPFPSLMCAPPTNLLLYSSSNTDSVRVEDVATISTSVAETSTSGTVEETEFSYRGQILSYVFRLHKKSKQPDVQIYCCYQCQKQNSKYTGVHVRGDLFLEDPCLPHLCIPIKRCNDKAESLAYESNQRLRKDTNARRLPPRKYWQGDVHSILMMSWGSKDKTVFSILYAFLRTALQLHNGEERSVNAHRRNLDMEEVSDDLRLLPEGSNFLQLQQPDMHLYYSQELVKLAYDNGLKALVGDGVHKLNPKNTPVGMERGQLYTIHAICSGEVEVPILYAVTRSKTKATYRTIFRKLKEELSRLGSVDGLRIVLDFEKAAIKAARTIFPEANI